MQIVLVYHPIIPFASTSAMASNTTQQDKHSMTPLTSNYQFNNNTHVDKKQTILSQYGQINTIKKNKKDNNYKDKKKSTKETKQENQDVGSLPQVESPTGNSKNKEEFKSNVIDPRSTNTNS
jgi:hypothetical protein